MISACGVDGDALEHKVMNNNKNWIKFDHSLSKTNIISFSKAHNLGLYVPVAL